MFGMEYASDRAHRALWPAVAACAAAAIIATACGSGAPEQPATSGSGSAPAGASVASNPELGTWQPGEEWRIREDLRLGRVDGPEVELFGLISDVEVDSHGNIYILDRQPGLVRVFDSNGRHLRSFGGRGRGPGEFQNPSVLRWTPNGDLLVIDPPNRRYTVIDTNGRLVTTFARPFTSGTVRADAVAFDEAGRFLDNAWLRPPPGGSPFDRPDVIVRFDSRLQPADTFRLLDYQPPTWRHTSSDGRSGVGYIIPFAPRLVWAFDHEGRFWSAVSDEYRLIQQTLEGDTVRVVQRQVGRVAVSNEDKQAALIRAGMDPRVPVNPDEVPSYKPPIVGFFFDDRGYIWVRSTTTDSRARALAMEPGVRDIFDVFDPAGRFLGHAVNELPGRLLRIRGGHAYAVTRDALDVEYVVRGRILGR